MSPKVLLDMDGVIVNFYSGFAKFLNKNYNCTLDPEVDPKSYSFEEWGNGTNEIDFNEASSSWIKQDGFKKLPAYSGIEEFVKELMGYCDVNIVTARIGDWEQKFSLDTIKQIKQNTFDWLDQYNIPNDKLFFTHEKIKFCKERGIPIMIEDKMSTALNASKNNIHTVLMNRGYNESPVDRFKIYRAHNFDEIITQIRKLITK